MAAAQTNRALLLGHDKKVGKPAHPPPPPPKKKKKNRVGQRARQAMAEAQFGRNAKHLAKPATAPRQPGRAQLQPSVKPPSKAAPAGAPAGDQVPQETVAAEGVAAEVLHPSWEAKRRQKALPLAAPGVGKKITFDDDEPAPQHSGGVSAANQDGKPVLVSGTHVGGKLEGNNGVAGRSGSGFAFSGSKRASDGAGLKSRQIAPGRKAGDTGKALAGGTPAASLHPSWEAKKLLAKKTAHIPPPAGTKIVFED